METKQKTTISIDDISLTIPYNGTEIEDIFTAIELALQLYGWHPNTIQEYILERAEEIQDER